MNARPTVSVALLALAVSMSGCFAAPVPEETPPAFSSEEEAFAAAEETYRAYVDALNQVDLSDPETFEPVFALTTGELNASDRRTFFEWHAKNYSLAGKSVIQSLERLETDVPHGGRSAKLGSCYDVNAVEVMDASGSSMVDEGRPAIQTLEVTFVVDDRLLISSISPLTEITC